VFGLTARDREFGPPSITLKEACQIAVEALANGQSVGYLFGTERTGLENEDLQHCSHRVWIDANPAYSSLNLSQAVMICAYELRQTQIQSGLTNATLLNSTERSSEKATIGAVNAALDHLIEGLEAIEFLDPKHPKKLMERLRAMFDRAQLEKEEIDLIRGIAKQMLNQNQKK
jgi:tRNA/rRNA methyltransferase